MILDGGIYKMVINVSIRGIHWAYSPRHSFLTANKAGSARYESRYSLGEARFPQFEIPLTHPSLYARTGCTGDIAYLSGKRGHDGR